MADNQDSLGALLDQYSTGAEQQAQSHQQDNLGALLDQYSVANNRAPGAPVMQQEFKPKGRLGTLGNLVYGLGKGAADLVQAPAQLLLNAANSANQSILGNSPDSGISKGLNDAANNFNQYLHNQEETYQNDTPGSIAAGVGRTIANVAPFVAAPQASGSKLVNFLVNGPGAAMATQPVNNVNVNQDGSNDFLQQKGGQAALGALGGAFGIGVGKVAKSLATPFTTPEAAQAIAQGVNLTPFQMLGKGAAGFENSINKLPIVGGMVRDAQNASLDSFNRAAYKRALDPIGVDASKIPVGNEGIAIVKNEISKAYDDILPKLQFKGDPQLGTELNNVVAMVNNGSLPQSISSQFNSIIKNSVLNRFTPSGKISGQQFKVIESDLGYQADGFLASNDPNQRALGKALSQVSKSLKDNLSRSNPEFARQLAKINEGYANYTLLRRAAGTVSADEGVFNPKQLMTAIKAEDSSAGHGNFATGAALMQDLAQSGKNTIPYIPDSSSGHVSLLGSIPNAVLGALGGIPAKALYSQTGRKIADALLSAQRPVGLQAILNGAGNAAGPLGSIGASQIVNQR